MTDGSQRLERSRLAILEHVHRKEQRRHGHRPEGDPRAGPERAEARRHAGHRPGPGGWYGTARDAVGDWWRYHPARMAVDLARPALAAYGGRKPAQYLAVAAVAGAGLFLLRPWKLISVTGVLVALLKSPQAAALLMQAMSSSHNPRGDEPAHE